MPVQYYLLDLNLEILPRRFGLCPLLYSLILSLCSKPSADSRAHSHCFCSVASVSGKQLGLRDFVGGVGVLLSSALPLPPVFPSPSPTPPVRSAPSSLLLFISPPPRAFPLWGDGQRPACCRGPARAGLGPSASQLSCPLSIHLL